MYSFVQKVCAKYSDLVLRPCLCGFALFVRTGHLMYTNTSKSKGYKFLTIHFSKNENHIDLTICAVTAFHQSGWNTKCFVGAVLTFIGLLQGGQMLCSIMNCVRSLPYLLNMVQNIFVHYLTSRKKIKVRFTWRQLCCTLLETLGL